MSREWSWRHGNALHDLRARATARDDRAIAAGLSKRKIGERFTVSPDAVWRHGRDHLTPELKKELLEIAAQYDGTAGSQER